MTDRSFAIGDLVSHDRHGEGVVLAVGDWDVEVLFRGRRGRVGAERLTLVLARAESRELGERAMRRHGGLAVARASLLWLRSPDPSLRQTAADFFSRSDERGMIELVDTTIEAWPPVARARACELLSEARVRQGLTPWREAVLTARHTVEVARREAADAAAAEQRRRLEDDLQESIARQIEVINQVRTRRGEGRLSPAEAAAVGDAVFRRQSDPNVYRNFCWNCWTPVDSTSNARCPECGWLACFCGACRKPTYADRDGFVAGMCPRESALDLFEARPGE